MAKILIVDDSPTERAFLEGLLTKSGYSVVLATSGRARQQGKHTTHAQACAQALSTGS